MRREEEKGVRRRGEGCEERRGEKEGGGGSCGIDMRLKLGLRDVVLARFETSFNLHWPKYQRK